MNCGPWSAESAMRPATLVAYGARSPSLVGGWIVDRDTRHSRDIFRVGTGGLTQLLTEVGIVLYLMLVDVSGCKITIVLLNLELNTGFRLTGGGVTRRAGVGHAEGVIR